MLSIFGGEFVACPLGHMYVRVIMLLNQSAVITVPMYYCRISKGELDVAILLQFKCGSLVPGLWKHTLNPLSM
jgi:hypothetical protein